MQKIQCSVSSVYIFMQAFLNVDVPRENYFCREKGKMKCYNLYRLLPFRTRTDKFSNE